MSQELDTLVTELRAIAEAAKSNTTDPDKIARAVAEVVKADSGEHGGRGSQAEAENEAAREAAEEAAEQTRRDAGLVQPTEREILSRRARNDAERDFQRAAAELHFATKLLGRQAADTGASFDPRGLRSYERYQSLARALNTTTAGSGLEFVPAGFSSQLIEQFNLPRLLAGQVRQIPIQRDGEVWLVSKGSGYGYVIAENTTDNPVAVEAATPSTRSVTFNAAVLGAAIPVNRVFDEDSAIAAMDWVMTEAVTMQQKTLESAMLSGDTASPHMDAAVTAANDRRRAFDGLRKYATSPSTDTHTDLGTFSEANVAALLRKMGQYRVNAEDVRLVLSIKTYGKILGDIANWPSFQTLEKIGDRAINIRGEVGALWGIPVVISPDLPETCSNAATDDGSGTDAVCVAFNTRGYALGVLRDIDVQTQYQALYQRTWVVATLRAAFVAWYDPATEKAVSVGYNIDVS